MKLLSFLFLLISCYSSLVVVVQARKLKGANGKGQQQHNLRSQEQQQDEQISKRALKGDGIDIDVGEIVGIACFSERSTVQVKGYVDPVSIQDVKLGDHILTSSNNQYAPVYAFGHYDSQKETTFLQLQTQSDTFLELTGDHLVFLDGKRDPVRADSVQKGDVLRGQTFGLEVSNVKAVTRTGVYTPLTTVGTVVVDGVIASSYVSLNPNSRDMMELSNGMRFMSQQRFVHMGLSPMRAICQGLPVAMSEHICRINKNEGMPIYVSFGLSISKAIKQCQSSVLQIVVLITLLVIAGACSVLEYFFGAAYILTAVVVVGSIYTSARCYRVEIRASMKNPSYSSVSR